MTKTRNGQLVPLKKRMNTHQQAKRRIKIHARRTIAEQLLANQQQFAQAVALQFYRRTLRGRFHMAYLWVKQLFTRKAA
jgi:hypothetical protein